MISRKVLDHGSVTLRNISGPTRRVDRMFDVSDVDPANSARMSFDNMDSDRTHGEDIKLAEYLIKNHHTTPIEMITVWIEMEMPIFVARQFCLGGKTELHFCNGSNNEYVRKMTIAEAADRIKNGKLRQIQQLKSRKLRSLDTITNTPTTTNIKDIWEVGEKEVYKVTIGNSKNTAILWLTSDHKMYTTKGWKALKDIAKLPTAEISTWEVSDVGIARIGRGAGKSKVESTLNIINESTERWVDLYNWESLYEISSQGRIRPKGNRVNHTDYKTIVIRNVNGYLKAVTTLWDKDQSKQITIARSMLESFLNPEPKKLTRHIDGNSLNNTLENLRYGSCRENSQDTLKHNTHGSIFGMSFEPIIDIEYQGIDTVYDLSVTSSEENFVAGGIVVHNCRHRTVTINEVSARYVKLPNKWYVPDLVGGKAKSNKQGQDDNLPVSVQNDFKKALHMQCKSSYGHYENALRMGVAPEHARMFLHMNHYTHWLWKQDLHNLMHFLSLRSHSHAQVEAQGYAKAIISMLEEVVPYLMEMYHKYRAI